MSSPERTLLAGVIAAVAAVMFFSSPASACHDPDGWCCVEGENGHPFCCKFQDDVLQGCIQR